MKIETENMIESYDIDELYSLKSRIDFELQNVKKKTNLARIRIVLSNYSHDIDFVKKNY